MIKMGMFFIENLINKIWYYILYEIRIKDEIIFNELIFIYSVL